MKNAKKVLKKYMLLYGLRKLNQMKTHWIN